VIEKDVALKIWLKNVFLSVYKVLIQDKSAECSLNG